MDTVGTSSKICEAAPIKCAQFLIIFAPDKHARGTTEMCSGSEAGSYSRLIDFVYHSTLGLRVIKKEKSEAPLAS